VTHPPVIRPAIFGHEPALVAAVSTRQGGASREPLGMNLSFSVGDDEEAVRENRRRFFSALDIPVDALAIPRQVHSAAVVRVGSPGAVADTDALVTDTPGLYLCVTVADCVPILLYDPGHGAVAAVHAGWRGSASGILPLALKLMRSAFGTRPGDLLAYVGPAAGGCCYEVGPEVAMKFPVRYLSDHEGSQRLDLKAFNADLLLEAGIETGRVEVSPLCTITESSLLHSHRRDGPRSGRMMAVIGIRPLGA
jgi:hypothetical protein